MFTLYLRRFELRMFIWHGKSGAQQIKYQLHLCRLIPMYFGGESEKPAGAIRSCQSRGVKKTEELLKESSKRKRATPKAKAKTDPKKKTKSKTPLTWRPEERALIRLGKNLLYWLNLDQCGRILGIESMWMLVPGVYFYGGFFRHSKKRERQKKSYQLRRQSL